MGIDLSSLMEIVERESEILETLSDLLQRQKRAATEGNLSELDRITEAQGRVYARMAELEAERLTVMKPLAAEMGMEPEQVTLTMLSDKFSVRLDDGMRRAVSLFTKLAEEVKRGAKLNGMIIRRCLDLGEQRFRTMVNFQQRGESYNFNGKKRLPGKNSGMVLNQQL